ncbi:hypothetical protein PCASD_13587 [Puccinia coronata f. sp. avenae]|uniref:Uncharacterized protein n=1 Tax=Puccinia coronata f. sp. avenae TaxID=200324 RepID=A0A2N5T5K4_9BASI|nr:hypothetical protein PCASD_13587 [Puccinia coronata f. sp. avenae]
MSQFHANQCQRLFDLVTRWQSSRRRQFLELDALKPESPAWRRSSARHEGHHGVKVRLSREAVPPRPKDVTRGSGGVCRSIPKHRPRVMGKMPRTPPCNF